jgi:hypothetical protein
VPFMDYFHKVIVGVATQGDIWIFNVIVVNVVIDHDILFVEEDIKIFIWKTWIISV